MIVDAVKDVGEVGLRIEAIQFGRFDDGHRARQCFCTGIRAGKKPVFSPNANRAQGPFGGVVVDCDATVGQE